MANECYEKNVNPDLRLPNLFLTLHIVHSIYSEQLKTLGHFKS